MCLPTSYVYVSSYFFYWTYQSALRRNFIYKKYGIQILSTIDKLLHLISISNPELSKGISKIQNAHGICQVLAWQQSRVTPPWDTHPKPAGPDRTWLPAPQHLNMALGRANADDRVTKHVLWLLVNRKALAQIKNTAALLCFLHMSLWQSHCSTNTAGAPICHCSFGKMTVDPRRQPEYTDMHIQTQIHTPN